VAGGADLRRTTAAWAPALIPLVVVVLAAAGCTSTPHAAATPSPVAFTAGGRPPAGATPGQVTGLVRHVWAATAAAGTAVLTVHVDDQFVGTPQTGGVSYTGTGPAVLPTAAADLRYRATPNGGWRYRFIGDSLYAPTPTTGTATPTTGTATATPTWTRLDLAAAATYRDGGVPANPVGLLRYLSGSLTSVTVTGSQILDGVPVTRYAATAELAAAAAAAPPGGSRLALHNLQQVTGTDHLNVQVWVDGHGRLRQLSYTDQIRTPAAGPTPTAANPDTPTLQTSTTILTLGNFGTPAVVTAPVTTPAP